MRRNSLELLADEEDDDSGELQAAGPDDRDEVTAAGDAPHVLTPDAQGETPSGHNQACHSHFSENSRNFEGAGVHFRGCFNFFRGSISFQTEKNASKSVD